MKYINKEMGLTADDFDFGDFDNLFKIKDSGWDKIFKYYNIVDKKDKNEAYALLKPHLKQITGSRLYAFSNSNEVDNFLTNDFRESSLLVSLKVLGIIKESGDSIYTDTGVYYENAIRSYIGNKNNVDTWNTFSLKNDEHDLYQNCIVNNEKITANIPINTTVPSGNIFNLPYAKINFNDQSYFIDLSIFGGMPDGYPIFNENKNGGFDLIEVKTKSFSKFKNDITKDEFGNNEYNAKVQLAVRVYQFVYNDKNELINASFVKQIPLNEDGTITNNDNNRFAYTKFKNGYSAKMVEITGKFPVLELDENNEPIFSESKFQKQFHTNQNGELVFSINDPSYYCQASLYALLTWLNKQIPRIENNIPVYDVSINDLANLKILFAMGIIKPEHYLKFDEQQQLQLFSINDGKKQRPLNSLELQQLLKVDELRTELYPINKLELVCVNSKYASNHHSQDNRLNLITLLAECSDKYLSFFKEREAFSLKDKKDKNTAKMLKRYFLLNEQELKPSVPYKK